MAYIYICVIPFKRQVTLVELFKSFVIKPTLPGSIPMSVHKGYEMYAIANLRGVFPCCKIYTRIHIYRYIYT